MFFEAQVITQEVNRGPNGLQGQVYLYRAVNSGESSDNKTNMHYEAYDKFLERIEKEPETAKFYFSVNNGKIVVAEIQESYVSTKEEREGALFVDNNAERTKYEVIPKEIDYKNLISQYTTPMSFFIALGSSVRNPNFLAAVVELIKKNTKIELTILDTTTTEVKTQVDKETVNSKERKIWTDDGGNDHTDESEVSVTTTTTTVTTVKSTVPTLRVTYANTWICEQNIKYNKLPDSVNSEDTTIEQTSEEEEELDPDQTKEDSVSWTTREPTTVNVTTTVEDYDAGTASEYVDKTDDFIELLDVKYQIPNSKERRTAGEYIKTDTEMLFELLRQNPETQGMEQVMRYIMYKYTGQDYGVTDLDFSMFDVDYFSTVTSSSNLADYLRQFSHSSQAPMSADGKYYKMYGDGGNKPGWPTIGNADIQWKAHSTKFAIAGKVLENGVEKDVPNVKTYVDSFLTRGYDQKYTNAEIENMQIYIERELVDQIGSKIQEVYYNAVVSQTSGLNLSRQQLFALTAIQYNFGYLPERNGYTFRRAYEEGAARYQINSWEHNRFIWDNWWNYIEGGQPGHIPSRDAAFETYVKGVYDFSKSEAGQVFSRTHYIYYTQAQINRISYAPNKRITRTASNEPQIFGFEEKTGAGLLDAAYKVHRKMEKDQENWRYSLDTNLLFTNNIEKSLNNPNRVTCCANYVSCVLYVAGYVSESEINSISYNSSTALYSYLRGTGKWEEIKSVSSLEEGDIVFMTSSISPNGIGHVQIYAGDGKWYNAGGDDSVKCANPYSISSSNISSRFVVALRAR